VTRVDTKSSLQQSVAYAASVALFVAALGLVVLRLATAGAAQVRSGHPVVRTDSGAVRGLTVNGVSSFRGLPYAGPPTGRWRWRPPRPPASWSGVRNATSYGASCPQPASAFQPPAPFSENCLYLNVSTPTLREGAHRPVLVWIHGGGLTQDAGRDYDGSQIAAHGVVVVTINYRLGALGFLAHPALASRPGASTGNYGIMDQQAALRWVQRNISRFGGNPHNVTIAGESAGGESVLAHLASPGSRGLFQRAIVQSGAFEMSQPSRAEAEASGEAFAANAGCPGQHAACLRHLPVSVLVANWPSSAPQTLNVDGKVLTASIGSAIASGHFARVPILDGTNRDEERIFVSLGVTVSGGTFVPIPAPVTAETYRSDIRGVLGVTAERAAAIAARYPFGAYTDPSAAFSALVSDANFVCPAVHLDRLTARYVPTFAYEFADDGAPQLYTPPGLVPKVATHGSELQYLFDLPNAPYPGAFTPAQQTLANSMRTAWAHFATRGVPSSQGMAWPMFHGRSPFAELVPPVPLARSGFAARHHCGFWATA
jgi:para-nitrobenzyl esterase